MLPLELTILMPCLNEAETLALCIQKAQSFLKSENIVGEILIADNGSQDGSKEIAERLGARVIHVPTKGYGAALWEGICNAQGKFIIMGDADDSYNFANLLPFIQKLRSSYDLVMGNRFKGKIEKGAMPFLNKYVGNPILSFLGRIFYSSKIGDFHCGLRGFKREAILNLNLQAKGMEFASEMIVKATLKNLKVTEVPTTLSPDGRSRRPHLRPWRDGWRHLRLLLLLCPRWLFLYPGLMLLFSGCFIMGVLYEAPVKVSRYVFDIHTMLFGSVFTIMGLQAILFFVFARVITTFDIQTSRPIKNLAGFIKAFTLERGLIIGLSFLLLGSLGACYAFWTWMRVQFGMLMPTEEMRILIPAITSIIVGMEIIFSSFFLSLLGVHVKTSTETRP